MEMRLKIFLGISLVGILILLFVSQNLEPQQTLISNITKENLNQNLKLQVKITSIKNFENQSFQILDLKDESGTISGTTNSRNPLKLDLLKNYTILGKVTEYNNTLQISINKISIG